MHDRDHGQIRSSSTHRGGLFREDGKISVKARRVLEDACVLMLMVWSASISSPGFSSLPEVYGLGPLSI